MNWTEKDNNLETTVKFKTTKEALDFIEKVSILADIENHHPKIVFLYHTVWLYLQTHDAGSIVTQKDYDLAEKMSKLL